MAEKPVEQENRDKGAQTFAEFMEILLGETLIEPKDFYCPHHDIVRIKDPKLYDRIVTATKSEADLLPFAESKGCWFDLEIGERFYSVEIDGDEGILFEEKFGEKYRLN
jgi:hypothetical protein